MTLASLDLQDRISEIRSELQVAQQEAEVQIHTAEAAVDSMRTEKSRLIVTMTVLIIFFVTVIAYGAWAVFGESSGFICRDQAAEAAGECTARWLETKDLLGDIITVAVLPIVTLSLGYYFGKSAGADA